MVNKPWSQDWPYWVGCRVRFSGGRVPLTINLLNLPLFYDSLQCQGHGDHSLRFRSADGWPHGIPWLLPAVQQWSSFRKADVEMRKKLLVHPGQHAVDVACWKRWPPWNEHIRPWNFGSFTQMLPCMGYLSDIFLHVYHKFTPNVTKCG